MSANHATSAQDSLYLDYFCRIGVSTSFDFSVGSYRYNVQQNDFKKDFRAKTAKIAKNFFLSLRTWRPCSARGRISLRLSLCESHPFSDLLLYLWILFVYHEVHEDHEEFIIKLYRPLCFKPRGLPRGIIVTWSHFVPFVLFVVIFLYLASFASLRELSFLRFPKFNGKFQMCLVRFFFRIGVGPPGGGHIKWQNEQCKAEGPKTGLTLLPRTTERSVRERVDECSELPARAVPQSHGRKSVVRGLL